MKAPAEPSCIKDPAKPGFFPTSFWSGNLFLIAPFPDLCLLVPFWLVIANKTQNTKNEWFHNYVETDEIAQMFKILFVMINLKTKFDGNF